MTNHLTRKVGFEGTPKLGPCWKSQFEEFALKTEVFAFASRSKGKAKPRRPSTTCSSTRTVPIRERVWTDIEPGAQSNQAYPVSKQLSTLLRHGHLPREEDGATEFWRLKDDLRNKIENSQHWSDDMWKSKMAGGGGNKKRFQYCTDQSGQEILYLRALQGHSARSLIDPTLHDNVVIPSNFFQYTYHVGCAISLRSITNSRLIPVRTKFKQTVFFTAVNPMDKGHKDPHELDLDAPRLAWCKQKMWKKHQNTVCWVGVKPDLEKGFKFYQTRSNAIILNDTLPAYCIPKAIMMEIEETNWVQKLLEEVKTPNKPNQKPKHPIVRTGRPVKSEQPSGSLTQEIDKGVLFGCKSTNVSTGRPVFQLCASVC